MTIRRRTAGVLLLLLLVVGCGDGKGGVALPCWVGKDYSVAESAADLRRLPPASEWVRVRGIPDEAVVELARFPSLKQLDFATGSKALRLHISAKGLSKVSELGLERLESLGFDNSPEIDDECLRQIARIRTLTELGLAQCTSFSKAGFADLTGLPNMQSLFLPGCSQITDDWIEDIARLKGLRKIAIAGTGISTAGRARLRSMMRGCAVDDDEEMWAVDK
jgi:hypothetical protein